MSDSDPMTGAIACCVLGFKLAGSWNQDWSRDSNLGTSIWDAGVSSGVWTSISNAYPGRGGECHILYTVLKSTFLVIGANFLPVSTLQTEWSFSVFVCFSPVCSEHHLSPQGTWGTGCAGSGYKVQASTQMNTSVSSGWSRLLCSAVVKKMGC